MSANNHIWYLMARCLNKEASEEEQKSFEKLLDENFELSSQYELLQCFWGNNQLHKNEIVVNAEKSGDSVRKILYLANASNEDTIIPHIDNSLPEKTPFLFSYKKRIRKIIYVSTAACLLFFIAKIFLLQKPVANNPDILEQQVVTADNGTRTRTLLPDGTVVWLNSGSKLTYKNNFKGSLREVSLEGEAFFDVVKDPQKPFIVHAANINIKVLGTAFNVKSYSSDSVTETTLVRGLVQINDLHQTSDKIVYLHPNEKITISKKTNDIAPVVLKSDNIKKVPSLISKIDTTIKIENRIETSWVYNRLVFHGENFKTLAVKLERWYNIKIRFMDENAEKLNFNGSFENETIEEAFAALHEAVPFTYKINDHEIFIYSAK